MNKADTKCARCGVRAGRNDERFRFYELHWKCDLILSQTLWHGLLCPECAELQSDQIVEAVAPARRQ